MNVYRVADRIRMFIGRFRRRPPVIPVLVDLPRRGRAYVWPEPRVIRGEALRGGSLFYTQGDCTSCPRCGLGNSTIAPYCVRCRALLPSGKSHPEPIEVSA